jgi:hypothetical protein
MSALWAARLECVPRAFIDLRPERATTGDLLWEWMLVAEKT